MTFPRWDSLSCLLESPEIWIRCPSFCGVWGRRVDVLRYEVLPVLYVHAWAMSEGMFPCPLMTEQKKRGWTAIPSKWCCKQEWMPHADFGGPGTILLKAFKSRITTPPGCHGWEMHGHIECQILFDFHSIRLTISMNMGITLQWSCRLSHLPREHENYTQNMFRRHPSPFCKELRGSKPTQYQGSD